MAATRSSSGFLLGGSGGGLGRKDAGGGDRFVGLREEAGLLELGSSSPKRACSIDFFALNAAPMAAAFALSSAMSVARSAALRSSSAFFF